MPIPVQCPQCRGEYQVADKFAGRKIRCPKCQAGVIDVGAPLAAQSSAAADEFRLKPDDASATELAPPPSRSRGSSQRMTRTLLMVSGGLLGVAVLIGGLAMAGKHMWSLASQAKTLTPSTPQSSTLDGAMPSVSAKNSSGDANLLGASSDEKGDPHLGQAFRPPNYPIEVKFPAGPIQQEQVANLDQYRWTLSPQSEKGLGNLTEVKLIVVPRTPNDGDIAAIETAKQRVRPLPPDESLVNHPRLGHATLVGHSAYMVSFEMPSRQTKNYCAYIPHREQIYVLVAVSENNCPTYKWMDIVHSIRFTDLEPSVTPAQVEPTEVAAAPQSQAMTVEEPKSNAPSSGLSGLLGGLDVSALWGGAVRMRSKMHPFEVDFPTANVIAFPKSQLNPSATEPMNYLHRLDAGMVHGESILHNDLTRGYATVFNVTFAPLPPGQSGEEMIKLLMSGFTIANQIPGTKVEANTITFEGCTALDVVQTSETLLPGAVVTERVRIIFHPTGMYSVAARSKEGRAVEDRFINSFHFLNAPGKPGDGSKLIPVLNAKGPRPTTRNISGQADPNGHFVMWDEIPVE